MTERGTYREISRFLARRDGFYRMQGPETGPVSIILAGVHGNEKPGLQAFQTVLPHLQVDRGTVYLGYGNPRAIKAGERQIEANLNRMFQAPLCLSPQQRESYERRRALSVMQYLDNATTLLDLHGTRNPVTQPFVITEDGGLPVAERLPADMIISGFDEFEPGGTDFYMNQKGDVGICLEAGYNEDSQAARRSEEAIVEFLAALDHVGGEEARRRIRTRYRIFHLYSTKTNYHRAPKGFKDFEEVKKDQELGTDGAQAVTAPKDGIILFANRDIEKRGEEAFLLAEKVSAASPTA